MNTPLYKSVRVVHNAHARAFEVYYRKWFKWHYEGCYKYEDKANIHGFSMSRERAKELALERAEGMLNSTVVWQQSSFMGY